MTEPAVEMRDVWRRYRVPSAHRPRCFRAAISRDPLRRRTDSWQWALRGVDLRVDRGEAVGVVGRNGAGKSTLLRLAGGVGRAVRGTVVVRGRVGALVDLGHELHPDLTGWQNAELAAVVGGLTRAEFRARAEEVLDFAGLTEVAHEPLRAYSDGMRARLAFSVAAHLEPDVLLVDEVLAVGDARFQQRSVARIEALQAAGSAVLFVAHDLGLLRRVCERAVWLESGSVRAAGESSEVVARYLDDVTGTSERSGSPSDTAGWLQDVRVLDAWGAPTRTLTVGDPLEVRTVVRLPPDHPAGMLRVRLVRMDRDTVSVDTSTVVRADDEDRLTVRFDRLDLAPGEHGVEVALFDSTWTTVLDRADATLSVRGTGPETAPLAPPHVWRRGGSG